MNNLLIQKQKKKRFNFIQGKQEITAMIDGLPNDGECYKFLSNGAFSSICFVMFVAERAKIQNLCVSSFRVGKKDMQVIHALKKQGRIENAEFVLLMSDNPGRSEVNTAQKICEQNGFQLSVAKNHSKIHLYDTDKGKFVLETSSNLNENPNFEQFSFEKDAALHDFYKQHLFDRMRGN